MNQKQAAIEQLFRKYHARLWQTANRLLHDAEESKDVVSDVFTRLMQTDHLPEEEKEFDRNTSIGTLKLIMKLGFKIKK